MNLIVLESVINSKNINVQFVSQRISLHLKIMFCFLTVMKFICTVRMTFKTWYTPNLIIDLLLIAEKACVLLLNVFALVWTLPLNYNIEGAQGYCAVFIFPSQSNGNIQKKPNMQSTFRQQRPQINMEHAIPVCLKPTYLRNQALLL